MPNLDAISPPPTRVNRRNLLLKTAFILGIIIAIFWLIFGILEFLSDPSTPAGLIEGGLAGIAILVGVFVGWQWPFFGGIVLVIEGAIPLFLAFTRRNVDIGVLFVGLPVFLVGILFLLAKKIK